MGRITTTLVASALLVAACGGNGSSGEHTAPRESADVAATVRDDLGALHQSRIQEVPSLIALFYHHPDGWAVEDTSLDNGATWCRHAWYQWELRDVAAPDDFTIRYTPAVESPDCAPIGQPLVLDVGARSRRDGLVVLTGEYLGVGLHAERTVCPGTLDDFEDVCGQSSGLGAPTERP